MGVICVAGRRYYGLKLESKVDTRERRIIPLVKWRPNHTFFFHETRSSRLHSGTPKIIQRYVETPAPVSIAIARSTVSESPATNPNHQAQ